MRATRDLVARYGALITVAVIDLSLADIALMGLRPGRLPRPRPGPAPRPATARAGRRAGGPPLARRGRTRSRATTQACPRPPPRRSPTTPETRASSATCTVGCWSRAPSSRATSKRSPATSRTMMDYVRAAPPDDVGVPRPHALGDCCTRSTTTTSASPERAENAAAVTRMGMAHPGWPATRPRRSSVGRPATATVRRALLADVRARMRRLKHELRAHARPGAAHCARGVARRLGRPGDLAARGGGLLRREQLDRTARRCRAMLGAAGAPVPRRGRGEIGRGPTALRALGVTSREVDVLKLVAAGLSNRAIGERLYLATKTVEQTTTGSLLCAHRHTRPRQRWPSWHGPTASKVGDPRRSTGGVDLAVPAAGVTATMNGMQTTVHEIADGVYGLSTCRPGRGRPGRLHLQPVPASTATSP